MWNIFVRLIEPDRYMEAITSWPSLLHAVATIPAAKVLRAAAIFLRELAKKCGAVDGPATLAANPRERSPSFSSGPSVALAQLTQPPAEKAKP
jgi:hypothetical protein